MTGTVKSRVSLLYLLDKDRWLLGVFLFGLKLYPFCLAQVLFGAINKVVHNALNCGRLARRRATWRRAALQRCDFLLSFGHILLWRGRGTDEDVIIHCPVDVIAAVFGLGADSFGLLSLLCAAKKKDIKKLTEFLRLRQCLSREMSERLITQRSILTAPRFR